MFFANAIEVGTDTKAVAEKVTTRALDKFTAEANGQEPSLCLVFMSSDYEYATALSAIRSVLPASVQIAGASTAGEISQQGPVSQPSIAVMLMGGQNVKFTTASASDIQNDSLTAGMEAAQKLSAIDHDIKLVMMFADGLKGNGAAILRGIESVFGDSVPVVGGSAGDNGKFQATHQFIDTNVLNDAVVLVGISGAVAYSVAVNHGWSVVGAPRVATKVSGTTIHEIDHKPAISLYEDYLGEEEIKNLREQTLGDIALSYPLGIKDEQSGETMLRAPFSVDDAGAIVCGGEVTEGALIQLMVGNKAEAVNAARQAAETAKAGLGGLSPEGALIFSCHVRNTLYASVEEAKVETDAIQSVIGKDVPLHGFYTYAEQAPIGGANFNIHKCQPALHNETVVVLLLASTAQ